jgi:transcription factor S
MVKFCPECSNILRRTKIDGKYVLICRCGFKEEEIIDDKDLSRQIERKKSALKKNLIIVKEEDKISVHPVVSKICPKCNNKEAEAWQEQTRSADEPSTSFFKCTKCKHTWREY